MPARCERMAESMMNHAQRDRILKMLEDGKITAQEAAGLLDAVGDDAAAAGTDTQPQPAAENLDAAAGTPVPGRAKSAQGRKLRVVVDAADEESGKAKVNVAVPLSLIRSVGPLVAHNMPEKARRELAEKGIDLEQILAEVERMLDEGIDEDLVHVETGGDSDGARVRVYVE